MFGFFKKKSKEDILQKKYETLIRESHKLSVVNRAESDKKYSEAHEVLDELEALAKEKNNGNLSV